MTGLPQRPPPKPWPMKWIVLVIVIFVTGYTLVNFYFRKPGPAYRPYQDAQDRATTARLLAAGWHKLPVHERRPAEAPTAPEPAAITRGSMGLGLDLEPKFAEKPRLLATIDRVVAPATVGQGQDYNAYFTASLADLKAQFAGLELYGKGNELVLVPTIEDLPGPELKSRWNDSTYGVNFPTTALPPGRYRARIVSRGPAAMWSFDVK